MILKQRTEALQLHSRVTPAVLDLPLSVVGPVYVIVYVFLDWLSFVHPFGPFGITPWNPPTGAGFGLILLFGPRYLPLLFVAPVFADWIVRGMVTGLPISLATAMVIGGGYSLATLFLIRPGVRFDIAFSTMRDLLLLLFTVAVSTAAVSLGCVLVYTGAGFVAWSELVAAALRYWIGDLIGTVVMTPFFLIAVTRRRLFPSFWEAALQIAAIMACLFIIFATGQSQQLEYFYLLFLPITWVAVRGGLEGVSAMLVLTQVGLISALRLIAPNIADVTSFQAHMLVLALTGLSAGVLVNERRRAELQLRAQQETHARLARLGSMGELSSSLAHEINQPLMAAGTYARLAANAMTGDDAGSKAGQSLRLALAQIERASEVVRRLRALIRLGRGEFAPVEMAQIVKETQGLLLSESAHRDVRIVWRMPDVMPPVMADLLQIEQVLLNLVHNAIEAIRDTEGAEGQVTVVLQQGEPGFIEVSVKDTGPGFDPDRIKDPIQPFQSTKADGLGVGLSLCRSIVEAHGGRIKFDNDDNGAVVRFTLPIAEALP